MSLSKRLRADWDYYQKQRRDRNAREEFVYDKGVAEGRTEGRTEGLRLGIEKEIFNSVF